MQWPSHTHVISALTTLFSKTSEYRRPPVIAFTALLLMVFATLLGSAALTFYTDDAFFAETFFLPPLTAYQLSTHLLIAAALHIAIAIGLFDAQKWCRPLFSLSICVYIGEVTTLHLFSFTSIGIAVIYAGLLILTLTPAATTYFKEGASSLGLLHVILRREFATQPRSRRFYWKRVAFVLIVATIIGFGIYDAAVSATSTVGLKIFKSLALTTLATMLFIPMLLAASSVVREKEDRTLGLLLLSDISAGQFLTGKLINTILATLFVVASVFPLFILSVSLGGVSTRQIGMAFLVLVSTIFLGTSLGLFIAAIARNTKTMGSLCLLSIMNVFIFLPLIVVWICHHSGLTQDEYTPIVSILSPFTAMLSLLRDEHTLYTSINPLFNMAISIPFLVAAHKILPRTVLMQSGNTSNESETATTAERKTHLAKNKQHNTQTRLDSDTPGQTTSSGLKRLHVRGNPICWRELNIHHGGERSAWIKCGITLGIILSISLGIGMLVPGANSDVIELAVVVTSIFSTCVFTLSLLATCSRAFNREKRDRTLDILLTTTLSPSDIVAGKLTAAVRTLLPWLTASLLGGVLLLTSQYAHGYSFLESLPLVVIVLAEFTSMAFCYGMLAMFISLRNKKELGFFTAVVVALLYNCFFRWFLAGLFTENSVEAYFILWCALTSLAGIGLLRQSRTCHILSFVFLGGLGFVVPAALKITVYTDSPIAILSTSGCVILLVLATLSLQHRGAREHFWTNRTRDVDDIKVRTPRPSSINILALTMIVGTPCLILILPLTNPSHHYMYSLSDYGYGSIAGPLIGLTDVLIHCSVGMFLLTRLLRHFRRMALTSIS